MTTHSAKQFKAMLPSTINSSVCLYCLAPIPRGRASNFCTKIHYRIYHNNGGQTNENDKFGWLPNEMPSKTLYRAPAIKSKIEPYYNNKKKPKPRPQPKTRIGTGVLCIYCGNSADTIDHLIPMNWFTGSKKMSRKKSVRRRPSVTTVPACRRCNSILGDKFIPDLSDRIDYVENRLEKL